MKPNENLPNEIEQERVSYLLNVDDMNYEMLAQSLVIRNESDVIPNSYIGVFGEINLVNGLIFTPDNKEFTEIFDNQRQTDFPTRKFQQIRPATLEDELAENHSYTK